MTDIFDKDSILDDEIIEAADRFENQQFPFKIECENINFSLDTIKKEYPDGCFPGVFRPPAGAKAKKLSFETIDPNIYEPNARMVAFRIERKRLEAWVRAFGILYYDHYGRLTQNFCVDWYDDPTQWDEENMNRAIIIDLIKNTERKYKISLFVTTGVVQVQGNHKDDFTRRDFPVLLSFVNRICKTHLNPLESLKIDASLNESSDNLESITIPKEASFEETCMKTTFNDHERTVPQETEPKVVRNKVQTDHNIQKNQETHEKHKDDNQNMIELDYMKDLQKEFVQSLDNINKSHASLIQQAEKTFTSAITNAIKPLITSINQLKAQNDSKRQIDSEPDIKRCNIKDHGDIDKKYSSLEKRMKEMEQTIKNLQSQKFQDATQIAELQSTIDIERSKFRSERVQLRSEIEDLKKGNDHISQKYRQCLEENNQLTEDNKNQRKTIDNQFDEILQLKSHISTTFSTKEQVIDNQSSQNYKTVSYNTKKNKPKALLVGTSNTTQIHEDKLSNQVEISKVLAYTLDETKEAILKSDLEPKAVILHSLTNEVKNNDPLDIMSKLKEIIEIIINKWTGVKIVVSLTTPRRDNRLSALNCEVIDSLIKREYMGHKDIYVSSNNNIWYGSPLNQVLKPNHNFHLSDKGVYLLASNIKRSIHTVLGIKDQNPRRINQSRWGKYR